MLPQPQPERPRHRIGRYVITGRIGRGGMGMVYRGLDEALEREVAVKTLAVEGTGDPDGRRRFVVEAKAAARLQHPNIVTVYELGEDRGMPFIAMELLPGADLETLLRSGEELPLVEKLDVVAQVCRGLAYAHEHGIVHRDIKPSNVRLLEDGTVKIMDFGIAKLGGTHLTRTGMLVGTVHYMSPEQVRGRPLDGRSDVFSAGVILYELLAGRRPFRGEGATQVLYAIVNDEPPAIDLAGAGALAPRLAAIVARALAKEPAERYPDAASFAADLGEALEEARAAEAPVTAAASDTLSEARAAARDGRSEEAIRRLRGLVAEHPGQLEARRALRRALREQAARRAASPAEPLEFPELEATFQAAATRPATAPAGGGATALLPTVADSGPAPLPSSPTGAVARTRWRWAAGLLLLVVGAAVAALVRGAREPAPAEARLGVRSQPVGAAVLVDGQGTGVVTNGELVLPSPFPDEVTLTFRRAGHRDETRRVRLPPAPGEAVSVTLQVEPSRVPVRTEPPGATVSVDGRSVGVTPLDLDLDPAQEHVVSVALDGYAGREVRVERGALPAAIELALERRAPAGTVTVASGYPMDVVWRGTALARGESSPRVSVPGGRQVLTLLSAAVFLRAELAVDVPPGGEVSVAAPPLGRLNVRALPDNCKVFVDGVFVDYPPILDRPAAAGRHAIAFEWPDGSRSQREVEVRGGAPAFVIGRKE